MKKTYCKEVGLGDAFVVVVVVVAPRVFVSTQTMQFALPVLTLY